MGRSPVKGSHTGRLMSGKANLPANRSTVGVMTDMGSWSGEIPSEFLLYSVRPSFKKFCKTASDLVLYWNNPRA